MSEHEYQGVRRIRTEDGAFFVPVCEKCKQFVRVYDEILMNGNGQPVGNNATCKKCGETKMLFEGYYE